MVKLIGIDTSNEFLLPLIQFLSWDDRAGGNSPTNLTTKPLAIIIKTTMDARDEILKYLLEKKDNRRMIDITELVKSFDIEPIQLRSVLKEIQSESLADIDSAIKFGNIIVDFNSLGNKTIINKVKHEIDLNDIINISGRINLNGEKLLTHGYNMKIEKVNIKAENVAFGEFNKSKINQSSSENKKSLIQKAINTIKKIVQNSFIALIVSYVAKFFK